MQVQLIYSLGPTSDALPAARVTQADMRSTSRACASGAPNLSLIAQNATQIASLGAHLTHTAAESIAARQPSTRRTQTPSGSTRRAVAMIAAEKAMMDTCDTNASRTRLLRPSCQQKRCYETRRRRRGSWSHPGPVATPRGVARGWQTPPLAQATRTFPIWHCDIYIYIWDPRSWLRVAVLRGRVTVTVTVSYSV